ncbi:type VII toxin-antitoxin system MntA family adenylyltransferase antitoxin [Thermofilum pendens]|uniref:DNA polymerase, beta domain protein region n=1 Tax=Thermofilum pendens (strain DSM 2475 / Hrk 5) TaxID=368408 RepID=A1S039_THEPD|nr:nucleotidyltransferase domain-containing protein [Thermofilum pendens]ABL78819.1 DNA polymerase, beta domain protein region [Thermofilum pendens Hrk 5]
MDPAETWEELRPVFEKHGVLFAYLFGSRARGLERENSDWDFAVYFGREVTVVDEARLEDDPEKATGLKVDVVALDNAPLDFVYVVLRDGVPVYSRDERLRKSWEIEAYLEYLDYEAWISSLRV